MRTPQEIETQFAPTERLDGVEKFHLVGIGGAGMLAIARLLLARKMKVCGVDWFVSSEIESLVDLGVELNPTSFDGVGALVLTDAVDLNDSPDVALARKKGIPIFRRSQVLAWLLRMHRTIAITGTHGKTTTTAMVGEAMKAAGLDPVVVVGAQVPKWGSAVQHGTGEFAAVEACEAYDALRDLNPEIAILTNLEADHLDFHGTYEALQEAVLRFVNRASVLIYCEDDPGAHDIANRASTATKIGYGSSRDLLFGMALAGHHNRLNAEAARTLLAYLGVENKGDEALMQFTGAERRLQVLAEKPYIVVDDYAHHPAEIRSSIQALREQYPGRKLRIFFQPHLYSRTAEFVSEFAEALSAADHVILTDIYPAREAPIPGVSAARIAEKVSVECDYIPSRHLLPRFASRIAQPGDVIVGMGAGTISSFGPDLISEQLRTGKLNVWVCYGGDSAEREVSLHSGQAIHDALVRNGHNVTLVDLSDRLLSGGELPALHGVNRPDVAFLAVHGTHAEDGAIQGFFEMFHIPHTGSGIQASAIGMDKQLTKQVLMARGLPVPRGAKFVQSQALNLDDLPQGPLIVKPNAQGSTVGLTFVDDRADLEPAIERAFHYDREVLVEQRVEGMEISCPVLNGKPLPVVEIAPVSGRYDFESKYTPGAAEEICPARLSPEVTEKCQTMALLAHEALGCQGATRTDMIVDAEGNPVILEVNTLPGMTPTSLFPFSAKTAGLTFDQLCEEILQDALTRART